MDIRLIIIVLLLYCSSFLGHSSPVKFYSINSLYGISIREMNSVCEDENGFVWASSKIGILRLTNNNYHIYQLPYQTADVFKVKLINNSGNLYAYTNSGLVYKYNHIYDSYEFLTDLSSFNGNIRMLLFDILIDDSGVWWVAASGGLYKYQYNKLVSVFDFSSDRYAYSWFDKQTIVVAKQDGIWLFNINSLEAKRIYKKTIPHAFDFFTVYFDRKQNKLWLGSRSSGLFLFNFKTGVCSRVLESILPQQPILSIEENSDSTCLIGYDGQGIWELDKRLNKVLNVYKEDIDDPISLRGNGVYDLFHGKNDRIWICTYTGGLSYYDQESPLVTQLTHMTNNKNSIVNNDVNNIIEDKWGKLWFATNNGISCFDNKTNKWKSFYNDERTQAPVFLTLCEDNQGKIWAGTYSSGVYVLDEPTGKELAHYTMNDKGSPLGSDFITNIFKDGNGDIWLVSLGGAVVCYEYKENKFKTYPGEFVSCIKELPDNKIVLGCSSGLILLNKEIGETKRLTSGMSIRDIAVINEIIWIATGGGGLISYNYKTGETETFTIKQGLPTNFINSILYSDNYLWLGTENGLCRFDPKKKNVFTYSSIYSLSSVSCNDRAHYKLKNGQLAIGTNHGVVIFSPDLIKEASASGKLFFQDLTIGGRSVRDIPSFKLEIPIDSLREVGLKYFQNTFNLELLSIGHSAGFKFSWKLDEADQQWTTPSRNNIVAYTNLNVGKYLLKIRLYDNSLTKILDERTVKINLIPPFWKTVWFDLLLLFIAVGIALLYFFYYVNRLKQRHTEEKVRFFTNTAHDIRTSLTLIKAPVEELNKETNLSETGTYYLKLAIEQARRLSSVVTQLMDFQKVDIGKEYISLSMVDVVRLISKRKIMLDVYAKGKNIDLVFTANRENYITAVDESKMEKIVDNLISNAVKYSPQDSQVKIELQCNDKKWVLQVKDQGIGISKKAQRKLFKEFYRGDNAINSKVVGSGIGLLLVKNYVIMHEGSISFNSQENIGSTFQIVVPFKAISEGLKTETHVSELETTYSYSPDVSHHNSIEMGIHGSSEMKVLIVEDNDDLLDFLQVALNSEFKVFAAVDGAKAWEFISKQMPDLVVSDIMMPNMDGYELCHLMKSTYETSHIPIILLTALKEKEEQIHGLGLGADDYLTKPFDVSLLIQKIKTIIRNRKVVREKALKLIKTSTTEPILENEHNDRFVKKILEVVKANISNSEFNKEEFASAMNVSSSLLYKKIKSLTDQSPTDFIKAIRLNHALELLQTRKYTVTEVSELCGFASVGYFSTVFRKHFSKSPTEISE